jgi:hypothetical protein
MRKIVEGLLRCTTLAIPVRSLAGPGIRQSKENSLSSWFNMERNLSKSIVAARPPYIALCVREALQPYVSFSKLARELTSD